jgi:hypothetical protein
VAQTRTRKRSGPQFHHGDDLTNRNSPQEPQKGNKSQPWDRGTAKRKKKR